MNLILGRNLQLSYSAAAVLSLVIVAPVLGAQPVEFVPVDTMFSAPPYPSGALTEDIVVNGAGAPATLGRLSSSIAGLNPVGAVDWYIADSFSFGVEREMKESGEKGGTADINIGVGELQECTISKSMDWASVRLGPPAPSGNQMGLAFDALSSAGMVEFASLFSTPQAAEFTDVSVVLGADGRSFDLHFSLLYSAAYDPALAILTETTTGNFSAVPEPSSVLLLAVASVLICRRRRCRAT